MGRNDRSLGNFPRLVARARAGDADSVDGVCRHAAVRGFRDAYICGEADGWCALKGWRREAVEGRLTMWVSYD
jgi:hypothetical protein